MRLQAYPRRIVSHMHFIVTMALEAVCHNCNDWSRLHIATLLGATCYMLRLFDHSVAACCDDLVLLALTIFKLEPTTPKMSQNVATGKPGARNMLRSTMLWYVTYQCCHRLVGALAISREKLKQKCDRFLPISRWLLVLVDWLLTSTRVDRQVLPMHLAVYGTVNWRKGRCKRQNRSWR